MRKPIVAGNAKMNLDVRTLNGALGALKADLAATPASCEVLYCPPFTLLAAASELLQGSPIGWGGQNMHWEGSGAYTGEVSASMLRELGCRAVIIGHSERRTLFGETDDQVRRKAGAALAGGLLPIVCVGETEQEREAGATEVVLSRQLVGSLSGLELSGAEALVLAYEPVWAIGTGKTATPDQAQAAHAHIRAELAKLFGGGLAAGFRILYGGSVKADNAEVLLSQPDVDGALVGGACLKAESFLPIIRAAR